MADILWRRLPLLLILATFIAGLVAWPLAGPDHGQILDHLHSWRSFLIHRPWLTGAGLIVLFAVSVGFGLPGGAVFVLAAGYLFGVGIGLAVSLLGGLAGALLTLIPVRLSGWRLHGHIPALGRVDRRPFLLLAGLRSIPVLPYTLVSIAGGMLRLSPLQYAAATTLGNLLPMGLLTIIGHRISIHLDVTAASDIREIARDPALAIPLAALGLLACAAWLFRKRHEKRCGRTSPPPSG